MGRPAWPQTSLPPICVGISRAAETLGRWREKLQPPSQCDAHRRGDRAWKRCLKHLFPLPATASPRGCDLNVIRMLRKPGMEGMEAMEAISAFHSHSKQPSHPQLPGGGSCHATGNTLCQFRGILSAYSA